MLMSQTSAVASIERRSIFLNTLVIRCAASLEVAGASIADRPILTEMS